jgi:hypothetical protein
MKVIDYSNTIMYKLVPNDVNLDLIYIGSTTNFRARKAVHKNICNNENDKAYNYKVYQMIRNNGGWCEWSMIVIEKYPCNDSYECRKRERELMEQYNANLNMKRPYISQEEMVTLKNNHYNPIYKATHKNETREYNRIYYKTNKEIINAKAREKYNQQKLASLNLEN